jgi:hypothetical protein
MLTRRKLAVAFGSLPFVGKAIAKEAMTGLTGGNTSPYPPRPPVGPYGYPGVEAAKQQLKDAIRKPFISRQQATKLLLQNKELLSEITSQMYEHERIINHIDPDINIYKSFSPMAKITFQRQRNVQRQLHNLTGEHSDYWGDRVNAFFQKVMFGGKDS